MLEQINNIMKFSKIFNLGLIIEIPMEFSRLINQTWFCTIFRLTVTGLNGTHESRLTPTLTLQCNSMILRNAEDGTLYTSVLIRIMPVTNSVNKTQVACYRWNCLAFTLTDTWPFLSRGLSTLLSNRKSAFNWIFGEA